MTFLQDLYEKKKKHLKKPHVPQKKKKKTKEYNDIFLSLAILKRFITKKRKFNNSTKLLQSLFLFVLKYLYKQQFIVKNK